jgi:hypothetical protein
MTFPMDDGGAIAALLCRRGCQRRVEIGPIIAVASESANTIVRPSRASSGSRHGNLNGCRKPRYANCRRAWRCQAARVEQVGEVRRGASLQISETPIVGGDAARVSYSARTSGRPDFEGRGTRAAFRVENDPL